MPAREMSRPGLFITLEGGEGAGKSTQLPRIHDWLADRGHDVLVTRQPGGTPLAERIRALLLDRDHEEMCPLTELLLLFADRAQFLDELVKPALARGRTVLCDRFTDSTRAYQGGGRGLPGDVIETLATLVHGDLEPDLTLLLDLPVEEGLRRAVGRGEPDRMERERDGFHQRVRETYRMLAESAPDRVRLIDASGDPEEVWKHIRPVLDEVIDRG